MNYEQFFKEMAEIEGVINVDVSVEPRMDYFLGKNVVSFTGIGQHGEEVTACVKHRDRGLAMDQAVNLANLLCASHVL